MKPQGVMVVTSKMFRHPLTDRANKNDEFAAVGGAILREGKLNTEFFPKYLLEEVGRCQKAGVDMDGICEFISTCGRPYKYQHNYMKTIRTKENATASDLTYTFKATVSNDVYAYLKSSAEGKGMSISKLIEVQALFIAEMEVTSKKEGSQDE